MALQLCPSCQEQEFTWHMAEDATGQEITKWACPCGYEAQADERLASSCSWPTRTACPGGVIAATELPPLKYLTLLD